MKYSDDIKNDARKRYASGATIQEVADALNVEPRTLYNWAKQQNWTQNAPRAGVAAAVESRIGYLLDKPGKSLLELLELERLLDHYRTMQLDAARRNLRKDADRPDKRRPAEIDDRSRTAAERPKRGRKPGSNDFTWIETADVMDKFRDGLFDYQLQLWEHRRERTRNILKSRQIGLTFYFAREAFADALLSGRNKIFLSASRAQAEIFKDYIKEFARDWFEVELKGGQQIVLHTPHGTATLYFLSTNSSTGQGRHGDVYLDEYFWMPGFNKVKKLISASASQKQWSRTFFSTPSTTTHEAYTYWTGDEYNERNRRANKPLAEFPDFETLRKAPTACPDGQMRWIITLDDAERLGCTLFDRAQLELEYSPEEFKQLFMCRFIDDKESVFKFAELRECLGDAAGFPKDPRRVWIGYDPSRVRDGACIVVVAPPDNYKGTFYVIEKITLRNASWSEQARTIRELTEKYNVEFIGIDATGPGSGVLEMVRLFFPRATAIVYTTEVKTKLVLKAQSVIGDRRIKWDAGYSDIAAGFLQIKKSAAGNAIIYYADRSEKTGHADAAWAIMHALSNEDLILTERGSVWSL
ncbi:MAG: terminase family protein [Victivallaceae bacterium]|nr:terminase family protein [Victivallaceae bacterium]